MRTTAAVDDETNVLLLITKYETVMLFFFRTDFLGFSNYMKSLRGKSKQQTFHTHRLFILHMYTEMNILYQRCNVFF